MSKFTQRAIDHINAIPVADERYKFSQDLGRAANRLARRNGYGRATKIDIRLDHRDKVTETACYGYRKDSTGEIVPNSYVTKCRGRGVSYWPAKFECQIGVRDLFLKA